MKKIYASFENKEPNRKPTYWRRNCDGACFWKVTSWYRMYDDGSCGISVGGYETPDTAPHEFTPFCGDLVITISAGK